MPFELETINTPESIKIHLCNNSIQKSAVERPTDAWADGCMWSSERFVAHLADQVGGPREEEKRMRLDKQKEKECAYGNEGENNDILDMMGPKDA